MIRKVFIIIGFLLCLNIQAQQNHILVSTIHTLQVQVNDKWNQSPLLRLNTDDYLNISFDDLTHEYHRYRYKIELCNFDWSKNESLFDSDYLSGESNDQPIEKYEKSLNTSVLYTHYSFRFPNERTGVRVSGNYKITVFDDDEEQDVITICFAVVDNKVAVSATATTNTDIDQERNHQQIKFNVNPQSLRITNPQTELKTLVLQNNRWDNAAINPKPDFVTPSDLQWKYAKQLIFKAGNEYRKFELTNLHYGTMGIDFIRWFEPYYHAQLYEGKDRKNYIYDEDQNGAFYIRTEEYDDATIQSDYILVHFVLKHEPVLTGELYVYGGLSNECFLPEYKMNYNEELGAYEAVVLLKQGYYNYQYLYLPKGKDIGETELIEGDYFQTENKYSILVYFRPPGGRYDQLVGLREFRYMPGS